MLHSKDFEFAVTEDGEYLEVWHVKKTGRGFEANLKGYVKLINPDIHWMNKHVPKDDDYDQVQI